jgi:hypothetical protein
MLTVKKSIKLMSKNNVFLLDNIQRMKSFSITPRVTIVFRSSRGCDLMVVGITTTCAISAYHQ